MSVIRYPQRIQSVHVESIDSELCVYDTARQRVHALNHTAAFVWQRCDGQTSPAELAAALSVETTIDDPEALVRLTLQELAAAELLAAPIDKAAWVSRRDLLRRGVAAAAIPAIHSIVAPRPAAAQSAPSGTAPFAFTGGAETFVVPAGVVSITIEATGARGGSGGFTLLGGAGGFGGRTTATLPVTPGASLTVRVGGAPPSFLGGFNGGGASTGVGGGGGGASSVHDGATPLVIAGGGGGGGSESGGSGNLAGGVGGSGGLTGSPGGGVVNGGGGGGGGTQAAGGAGGTKGSIGGTDGTAGVADQGGIGGAHQPGVIGGGGGGGGYFGGGGGGGGSSDDGAGGGGGGSSFAAPSATGVAHQQGINSGAGSVTISW